ncbi:MAG: FeoA family protein [Flavobacteriaceae bacterium]|nr:FeoA family protein [Flavobacteriaceae bacterium]
MFYAYLDLIKITYICHSFKTETTLANLAELKKGEKAKILGYSTEDIPAKFLELGLVPGEEIEFRCSAPFNGPVCVALCKSKCILALRKSEASEVLVKIQK